MNSRRGIINGNTLEELEYRRCTWWSNFLENVAEREDGEVYDVNSIAEQFEDDTSNDDGDEAEEVEVLEDIEYHNLMNHSTQQEKTSFIMESEEVQDILNSTRPVLKEHALKLKKTGLEKIMNTFDSVRIEREVGGWMRRNHSTDYTQQSDSDSDSSMSCEDDHYIRSVQKCHLMRKTNDIPYFKKCKNFQTACCKYGMLVETKSRRSYSCNCSKNNSIKSSKYWKMTSPDDPEINDKRHGKHKLRHCIPECSSSSSSDYNAQEKRCLKRNMTPSSHTERKSDKKCFTTNGKHVFQKRSGKQMVSMIEEVYETPTKSTVLKSNIPNTAPSKIGTKQGAARRALSVLHTNKIEKSKSTKSKRVAKTKTQENKNNTDCETTFENNVKTAIAFSLENFKQNRISDSPEHLPRTTRKNASKLVKKHNHLTKINRNAAEEVTFLNNLENICNSTALNGAAACKQLPSSLPAIHEDSECSSTITPSTENADYAPRKKTKIRVSALKECPTRGSEPNSKTGTQFKNVFSSTTIQGAADDKVLIYSPSVQEQVTPCKPKSKLDRMRHATTEPRRKQRGNVVNNKTMGYRSSVSSISESSAKSNPIRIMLYTPQRKAPTMEGHFQVTKELMSSVIGEDHTRRFFKYHVGPLTFPKTSTVYYCPPEAELSSSESDDDPLLKAGCCGELYESEKLDDSNAV